MNRILWIDDEIEFLKPHIMFLTSKGYDVTPVVAGSDALDMLAARPGDWDVILLDENMPGLTGLQTLERLKIVAPNVPVVMITKSEEENLMDQAVGNQIKDYLIKPVNPNQILHTLKRLLHAGQLVSQQATVNYHKEFTDMGALIAAARSFGDWCEIYRRLTVRLLEFNATAPNIVELIQSQYHEAQKEYFRFVKRSYAGWFDDPSGMPLMSHLITAETVLPRLKDGRKVTLLVMDNFRFDQWLSVQPIVTEHFDIARETFGCSLLPTATQYARNALFSGLLPSEIQRRYPELWVDEDSEEGKNLNEEILVRHWLDRNGLKEARLAFHKANNSVQLAKVINDVNNDPNDLTVIVINFIDILSHAKTDSDMIKELAANDAGYRSLTISWFRHSPVSELLEKIARGGRDLVLTTDHGSIRVKHPVKVVGERNTTTALRYKHGRNLAYPAKEVLAFTKPLAVGLPAPNLSTTYIFAGEQDFFAYNNNFNYYVKHFTDTYQHGGVSFEEMIVPVVILKSKI